MSVFVFGSNLAGRHGKGAALFAKTNHGAEYGVGVGRTGNAYAIPTKDERIRTLPLSEIRKYVAEFLVYAQDHPDETFQVTRVGCGLAGYKDSDIAPMFAAAPRNCQLPIEWFRINQEPIHAPGTGCPSWADIEAWMKPVDFNISKITCEDCLNSLRLNREKENAKGND